jgi:hypothetical protein
MSGIVRRQPLPAGQTATAESYPEAAEGGMPPAGGTTGSGAQTVPSILTGGPVSPNGVINANKISFYPTGPTRQSQLQA